MGRNLNDALQTRQTASNALFDQIRDDINKMHLVPGTKITEAEVAKLYDVSRQPVREAFIRLDNLSLLEIRPQKATIVRRMSKSAIRQARFVRASVEIEVARLACKAVDASGIDAMQEIVDKQAVSLKNQDVTEFHSLDHDFHKQICLIANCEFAVEIIGSCKAKVDRLCMLALGNEHETKDIFSDHVNIVKFLAEKNEDKLVQSIRDHLARLDDTIETVQSQHSSYFEE